MRISRNIVGAFTFFLLCTASFATASGAEAVANSVDKKGRKQGAWLKKYKNGQTQYTGNFKDGKPVGEFRRYYSTGKLQAVQMYGTGEESTVRFYDVDGKTLTSEGGYIGKKKNGAWRYYSDGKVVLEENYANGKKEGIARGYIDGHVIEEVPYVNDLVHGMKVAYLENGKLYSKTPYVKGKMNGEYNLYNGNEKPIETGRFVNDEKEGLWIMYDEKGNETDRRNYVHGIPDNQKSINKAIDKTIDENDDVVKQGKYKEPTELFGGSVEVR